MPSDVAQRGHLRLRPASPKPYGDALILDIVRESEGLVLDFDDQQILASLLDWARHEGLFLSPEGAAATAAYDSLLANGWLSPDQGRHLQHRCRSQVHGCDRCRNEPGIARASEHRRRTLKWTIAG